MSSSCEVLPIWARGFETLTSNAADLPEAPKKKQMIRRRRPEPAIAMPEEIHNLPCISEKAKILILAKSPETPKPEAIQVESLNPKKTPCECENRNKHNLRS